MDTTVKPKGEWKYALLPNLNKEIYYCSNCDVAFPIEYRLAQTIKVKDGVVTQTGEYSSYQKDFRFNFCPCCGADMC